MCGGAFAVTGNGAYLEQPPLEQCSEYFARKYRHFSPELGREHYPAIHSKSNYPVEARRVFSFQEFFGSG